MRRQLDGWHLPFGEYLQYWTTLYLLNLPINRLVFKVWVFKLFRVNDKTIIYYYWMWLSYHLKNYRDLDNTFQDLHHSSDDTQPHPIIIVKYLYLVFLHLHNYFHVHFDDLLLCFLMVKSFTYHLFILAIWEILVQINLFP